MQDKEKIITNKTTFTEYSFAAVFEAIQPFLKEGYEFDLETNEGYPQQLGHMYLFTVREYELKDIPVEQEPEAEPEQPKAQFSTRRAKAINQK